MNIKFKLTTNQGVDICEEWIECGIWCNNFYNMQLDGVVLECDLKTKGLSHENVIRRLYTGRNDRHGNGIYVSDIIKKDGQNTLGTVKYINCSFIIDWRADLYGDLLGWEDWKRGTATNAAQFEIVGNVFLEK